jgi:hypothetical protein
MSGPGLTLPESLPQLHAPRLANILGCLRPWRGVMAFRGWIRTKGLTVVSIGHPEFNPDSRTGRDRRG